MGDGRTYEWVVALRAVQTQDFMTAHWAHLPHELLGKVSNRIINEVRGINRVVYAPPPPPPPEGGGRPPGGGGVVAPPGHPPRLTLGGGRGGAGRKKVGARTPQKKNPQIFNPSTSFFSTERFFGSGVSLHRKNASAVERNLPVIPPADFLASEAVFWLRRHTLRVEPAPKERQCSGAQYPDYSSSRLRSIQRSFRALPGAG